MIPPLVALVLGEVLWSYFRPSAWFLVYPAIFISSWIGGLRSALVATAIGAVGVLWMFVPPEHGIPSRSSSYVAAVIFVATGVMFAVFHERLRCAAAEARLAEAKSSGIVSIAADAIICVDEAQCITQFNEGATKIFGYSKEEIIGASLGTLIPERFRTVHHEHVQAFGAGESLSRHMGEHDTVIVGLRKNGEEFPADAAISKLDIGGTRMLTVALRDITEQKRTEEEQALLAEIGAVVASTLELPALLTKIGQLTTRSLADACVVYAVDPRRELRRVDAVIPDPAKAWLREALLRMPATRERAEMVWSEVDANRTVLVERITPDMMAAWARGDEQRRAVLALDPRSVVITPLFARDHLVGAMSLISSTPTHTYTQRDVKFFERIAQRVALAVDNAILYDQARRASKARDDVLGIVAHDLRNPLGAILLQAGMLADSASAFPDGDGHVSAAADMIARSARRMHRLLDDLLDVTRIEEGSFAVSRGRLSAREIVSEVLQSNGPRAEAAHLEIRVDVAPGVPDVYADHDRLLQILENLVGNALKFTDPGGLIAIGAGRRGDCVQFYVADTGCGIATADLPYVFDRFWQAQKDRRGGAGLGLAIAKGLVEAHGGQMWVESTPGRGTTFFFTIPIAPELALVVIH